MAAALKLFPWLLLAAGTAAAGDLSVDVRDTRGTALADVVVYAEPASGTPPAVRAGTRATIDQVAKEFTPRVSVVQAGTEIFFPNSDNIRHSIYSFSSPKTFTTKLYSGREAPPVLFDKTGLVVLGCNIHDQMVAFIRVVDTPWAEKTAADGTATLKSIPAGKLRVSVWHPYAKSKDQTTTQDVTPDASGAVTIVLDVAPPK